MLSNTQSSSELLSLFENSQMALLLVRDSSQASSKLDPATDRLQASNPASPPQLEKQNASSQQISSGQLGASGQLGSEAFELSFAANPQFEKLFSFCFSAEGVFLPEKFLSSVLSPHRPQAQAALRSPASCDRNPDRSQLIGEQDLSTAPESYRFSLCMSRGQLKTVNVQRVSWGEGQCALFVTLAAESPTVADPIAGCALAEISGALAHDLRNLLTVMRYFSFRIKDQRESLTSDLDQLNKNLDMVGEEIARSDQQLLDLVSYFDGSKAATNLSSLEECIIHFLKISEKRFQKANVAIDAEGVKFDPLKAEDHSLGAFAMRWIVLQFGYFAMTSFSNRGLVRISTDRVGSPDGTYAIMRWEGIEGGDAASSEGGLQNPRLSNWDQSDASQQGMNSDEMGAKGSRNIALELLAQKDAAAAWGGRAEVFCRDNGWLLEAYFPLVEGKQS